jgi:LemA protein
MKKTWIVPVAIVAVLALWALGSYNSLVTAETAVDTQWSQVETQYQRRLDLIPNLVESTKGVLRQEQEVFTAIAEARANYAGNPSAENANQVESALSRLLVIVENYPELKSSNTVSTLMAQLEGTENRVSTERMRYNEAVQAYNLKVKRFPGRLAAAVFGFDEKAPFESVAGAENAPQVDLQLE